mmetsp:Transcript_7033/g.22186  ORF Transcript_7033/g.22186 Transcript_7033/m.22186 type:complete len:204 (-) Transcript_7033:514-1125(-)
MRRSVRRATQFSYTHRTLRRNDAPSSRGSVSGSRGACSGASSGALGNRRWSARQAGAAQLLSDAASRPADALLHVDRDGPHEARFPRRVPAPAAGRRRRGPPDARAAARRGLPRRRRAADCDLSRLPLPAAPRARPRDHDQEGDGLRRRPGPRRSQLFYRRAHQPPEQPVPEAALLRVHRRDRSGGDRAADLLRPRADRRGAA